MLVQEMHIGVNQWLQKINAKETDSFKPHEIDWALNEECLRFIKQRTSTNSDPKKQGFQRTQKRYDDIEELITSSILPCYVKDNDSVFSFLPQNYFRLINDRSILKDLCGASLSTLNPVSSTKKVCVVPFPSPPEITAPYYTFLQIKRQDNAQILFDINDYTTTASGLSSKEQSYYVLNLILEKINTNFNPSLEVRWETFNGIYYPNCLIFITEEISFTGINLTTLKNYPYSSTDLILQKYNLTNTKEKPNRLTNTEDLYVLLNSVFGTTVSESPISSLERGKIIVHHNQKFILSFVNIQYIRKPRKIDLFLNQSCELNPNVHEEIVEATAKRISGITKGENYQQLINENLINE